MRYMLTLEQMIENGYPIPSYLADVFEKPPGWVETKVEAVDETLLSPPMSPLPRIYAMDCEMVRLHYFSYAPIPLAPPRRTRASY